MESVNSTLMRRFLFQQSQSAYLIGSNMFKPQDLFVVTL